MSIFYREITEFDKANEDWVNFVERMALFFEANGIEEETKKKILLFNVGAQTYKLQVYQCQANLQIKRFKN